MRGKIVTIEKCSAPLLNWYRAFIGKKLRVDLASKNPFAKAVLGVDIHKCYAVIADDPRIDTKLILIDDTVEIKKGVSPVQITRHKSQHMNRKNNFSR